MVTYRKEIKWNVYWKLLALWEFKRKNWEEFWRIYELVRCTECGYEHYVDRPCLLTWKAWCRKCGHIKHWKSKGRLFRLFTWIKQRCTNKKNIWYKDYWARWIKCLWNSYEEFARDMEESYKEHCKIHWEKDTTIERIDVNWNYCKENCTRATNQEQADNKRWSTWLQKFIRENWLKRTKAEYRYFQKWLSFDEILKKCKEN